MNVTKILLQAALWSVMTACTSMQLTQQESAPVDDAIQQVAANEVVTQTSPATSATVLGPCRFNIRVLTFQGEPRDQARCLLRDVRPFARLGPTRDQLPPHLNSLVGEPVRISRATFRNYLASHSISESEVGGSLDRPLSRTQRGFPARYFVIHDTSTPYLGDREFPQDLDTDQRINNLGYYRSGKAKAHIFVNRRGETYLGHDFSVPWRATKLEFRGAGVASRGLFLHIENVQPRRRNPRGGARNDALAPIPGFSQIQYDRLALLYAGASIRSDSWLIPAFHTVLDQGFPSGHDDPQNFELNRFDEALGRLLQALQ